jgi:hypothetical protein
MSLLSNFALEYAISETFVSNSQKRTFINLNPSTPALKGLINMHQQKAPIRPVINWRNTPSYNVAKWEAMSLMSAAFLKLYMPPGWC